MPRTYIFAGKAAPGYWAAKQVIKLVCQRGLGRQRRPACERPHQSGVRAGLPRSLAETIIPGADLSEQISTAGSEASGTGNMKLPMNGALTIGTLDGANVEMLEAIGAENFFLFGLTADQIQALRENVTCRQRELYQNDSRLKRIVDAFDSTLFSPGEPGLFHWIVEFFSIEATSIFILRICRPTSTRSTTSTRPSDSRRRGRRKRF